jgi:hypothetical protein
MSRNWVLGAVVFVGCGQVVGGTPDAQVMADAAIDADPNACMGTPPDATFQYSLPAAPVNVPITFTPAAPGLSYAWTFANGSPATSTMATPMVSWTAAAANAVALTVSDTATHCSAMSMQNVQSVTCQAALNCPGVLTTSTTGHPDSGIVIVPKVDTTLLSFKVVHQGKADTFKLLDDTNAVLQMTTMPEASENPYPVTVAWPLTANARYRLVTADNANNKYASIASGQYPTQNASLSVPAGWMDNAEQAPYWFGFTELVTCP